jgi:EAL domain-containing protein (putative c-di-GMP-specific phosphodiesterase class I)/GGDEF domain-containing protein
MTLGRQLLLTGLILLLSLFSGLIYINLQNTQTFLNQQLAVHAQDTATVLGLSLTTVVKDEDQILMGRIVDSVWDAGYYQKIRVENLAGKPLVERTLATQIHGVPKWFIRLVPLEVQVEQATIQAGWQQVGKLWVESNPGFAYFQLWQGLKNSLKWLGLILVAALIVGSILLHFILKPLRAVTQQANAICNQQFSNLSLPWTLDLRQVVVAMNKMSTKLEQIFKEHAQHSADLRAEVYKDPVTKIGNRKYFSTQFKHLITDQEAGTVGALLLISLHDFEGLKERKGYVAADEFLKYFADNLLAMTLLFEKKVLAHLDGPNFAILLPYILQDNACELATTLCERFAEFQGQGIIDRVNVAHIGLCRVNSTQTENQVLSRADMALTAAQSKGINSWHYYEAAPSNTLGAEQWKQLFETVIAQEAIVLHFQKFQIFSEESKQFSEVLVKVEDHSGQLLSTSQFLPMAERLHVIAEIDKIVVTRVLEKIASAASNQYFSINVCATTLDNPEFAPWLFEKLKKLPKSNRHLIFELPEYGVVPRMHPVREFFKQLRQLGFKTVIDHFGRSFSSFSYLHSLPLDYVKIDGGFIKNIDQIKENQFIVKTLIKVAHSLDILTIAETVTTQAELDMLTELKIDGIEGHLLGAPYA